MSEFHWVIGAGGLLGSAVTRHLRNQGQRLFEAPRIAWDTAAIVDLAQALSSFLSIVGDGDWTIYWCAGSATTASSSDVLNTESRTFEAFLKELAQAPMRSLARGAVFLASSAGAIYGGSSGAPFSELSISTPLGAYGQTKLTAEERLRAFSDFSGMPAMVGRIANLYGPGQRLSKMQGLISRLCVSSLTKTPISVFVPMDTLREYFYVDDCADLIVAATVRAKSSKGSSLHHLKVMSSGRSVSIGALLSQFQQVDRKRPYVILGQSAEASLQSRDLRLRSVYWPDLDSCPKVNLADGIARTLEHVRSTFLRVGSE
jgi:UDP-glucose 4-epimerase